MMEHLLAKMKTNQERMETQMDTQGGEPLKKVSTVNGQVTHCIIPTQHKNHVCVGSGMAFGNRTRD
jgi:hypothetical protein